VDYLFLPRLFCLVALYHIPSSAVYFSVFSFGLIYWVWGLLSAGWKVVVPLNCGVYSPWVGWDQCLVKVSWLEGLVPVSWWMELDLVFLEGSAVSSSVFWGVCDFTYILPFLSGLHSFCWSSAVGLMGVLLYVICWFSLAAFNICSCVQFSLVWFICVLVFLLGFILYGTLGFLNLGGYFLSHFRETFNYILFKYFLMPFTFVFFF